MADDIDTSHYNTGTATIASGAVNVVGQGTTWTSIRKGDMFGTHVGDGIRILDVVDDTHLTLAYNWTGPSQTALAYEIQRTPFDIGYLESLEDLIDLLNSGNLAAFAALVGAPDFFPMFTGAGTLTLVSRQELIAGIEVDARVETLPDRAAYDGQLAGFTVTVNDIGDGRAAFYFKKSNASADWSTPAYLTGPVGPPPVITAAVTPTAPGTTPSVNTAPISGGYNLEFLLPLQRGAGFQYEFATATGDANPGAGNWRANNAAFGSATQLFISKTTDVGADLTAYLLALASSTTTNKGTLVFQRLSDGVTATWTVAGVTDATGYVKVAVSGYSGPSVFTAADLAMLQFTRTGDKGADGTGTGDVVGPSGAINNRMVEFDGTTGKLIKDSGVVVSAFMKTVFDDADAAAARTTLGAIGGNAGSTDNRLLRADGTGGATLQGSAVTLDDSGNLTGIAALTSSGLMTLNGGQIAFPATQVPSSDANTLDDYEEGTYTPTYANIAVGNGVVNTRYTKVGRFVSVKYQITFGTTSSLNASAITIGLPFTGVTMQVVGPTLASDVGTAFRYGCAFSSNGTAVTFTHDGSPANWTSSIPFSWTTNDVLTFSYEYNTAT